ncbi:MAG: hypothetical protein K5647_09285 [Clostridiales bacterium]|nr:hypothetical protein [Clostridiales bacterium]
MSIILVAAASAAAAILIAAAAALIALDVRTRSIRDDFSSIYEEEKYAAPVSVGGIEAITQEVSCGYAVIEMFSGWCGGTEEITVGEFLDRTSFAAYERTPLFLKLGFAFGVFEKNTVFAVEPVG